MARIARRVFLGLGTLASIIQVATFATGVYSFRDMWSSLQVRATSGPRAAQWVSAHQFQIFFPVMVAFTILMFASGQRIEVSPMLDSPRGRLAVAVIWYTSLAITVVGAAVWLVTWGFLGFFWR